MPFKTYFNWLFDGNIKSPIPSPKTADDGKVIVPNILKLKKNMPAPVKITNSVSTISKPIGAISKSKTSYNKPTNKPATVTKTNTTTTS